MSLAWQLTIRTKADDGDLLVVTSLGSGSNPLITGKPVCDGFSVNPLKGEATAGGYTVQVADSAARVLTAILADANGKWQVLGNRAYLKESTDGGSSWPTVLVAGHVTICRMPKASSYEIAIGDGNRKTEREIFRQIEGNFVGVTCYLGGPIIGGFGPINDNGPMRFRVVDVQADYVDLEFVSGWMYPTDFIRNTFGLLGEEVQWYFATDNINDDTVLLINKTARALFDGTTGSFPNIAARVLSTTTGATVGTFTPLAAPAKVGVAPGAVPFGITGSGLISIAGRRGLRLAWTTSQPSDGDLFDLYVYPTVISRENPLYWEGHPIQFLRDTAALIDEDYDTAIADATEAAMGPMELRLAFTGPERIREARRRLVGVPFGVIGRPGEDGETEFIAMRRPAVSAPVDTYTLEHLAERSEIWRLAESSIVNRLVWKQQQFLPYTGPADAEDRPLSGLVMREQTYTYPSPMDAAELASPGIRDLTIELPGELVVGTTGTDGGLKRPKWPLLPFITAMGEDLRDRYGHGCDEGELILLKDSTTARHGDLVVVDLSTRPGVDPAETPAAQRGLPTIMQVVKWTPDGGRRKVGLWSMGMLAEQADPVPTFTLGQLASDPRHRGEVTLTNSAALIAAGVRVEARYNVGASEPASGVIGATHDPNDGAAFSVGPVDAGSTLWVSLRSVKAGLSPSDWSAWQSVALDAIPPITGLANAIGANDTERLITWTVGAADLKVRVRWKLTADDAYSASVTLEAGSTQFLIPGLTPGSGYTASVQHIEDAPYAGVSADETTSWTNGGTVPTLDPPTDPQGFVNPGGAFGLTVAAAEIPSNTEFEIATEDSVGAGTFGAFVAYDTVPSEQSGPTTGATSAPNDGLTYQLRARHTREGWTSSAYTTPVTVDPWGDPETPAPPDALSQSTDTFPIQLSGIGGTVEWVGLKTGGLALQYTVDDGATWPFFTQTVAAAYAVGQGPFVSLEAGDVQEGNWAEMVTASRANVRWRLVAIESDGTVTVIAETENAKVCTGYKYVRLIANVGTAGTVTTDPITENLHVEFAALATQVVDPPADPDPPGGSEGCSALDTYPVARALEWWALCDCGTWSDGGTGLKITETLTDLSGNGNTLTKVAGATVKRFDDSDGAPIPQINGRDPLSFKDAELAFPITLFDGMTEGELFLVVKGNAGDPATNTREYFCQLGPSDDARWAVDTGGGADTGQIREDFGSTVLHSTGDVTGALDDPRIYNVRAAAGHYTIAVDGVVEFTTASNTVAFSALPKLGNRGNNSHFHFGEGAIHSALLTTAERALVLAKLQERWGL